MTTLIVLIIGSILLITYFVGDYFVRYSLVPNSGAEDRVVVSDEDITEVKKQEQLKQLLPKIIARITH